MHKGLTTFKIFYLLLFVMMNICSCQPAKEIAKQSEESDTLKDYSGTSDYFIDERDGKSYKWVRIGDQIWMAENLAFKADSGCVALNNNKNNIKKYGYLYDGNIAQKIAPKGWHLPSKKEYETLCNFFGNNMKESFYSFKKLNSSTFNSLNSGRYNKKDDKFIHSFIKTFRIDIYWTSSLSSYSKDPSNCYHTLLINYFREIMLVGTLCNVADNEYFPIRCIKD